MLISAKSIPPVGTRPSYVDIVQDVINLLPIHLISEALVSLLYEVILLSLTLTLQAWTSPQNQDQ
jgi:hypothetical protein